MINSQGSRPVDVDVLIVGSGPVGSALSVELGMQGISCRVIERRKRRLPQPRAKLTNIRTMGLMRRFGLADGVRAKAPLPADFPSDIAFVTRLTDWELTRFPNAFSTARDHSKPFPESAQQIPQDMLEEVLRERAEELPSVVISTGATVESFEQDATGVDAIVADGQTGEKSTVRARYLAGCDGARSTIRRRLAIGMPGRDLAANVSAVFRAPSLWSRHDKERAVHYWATTPDAPSILGPLDPDELWWFHLNEVENDGELSDDEVRRKFFAAVGTEFPCEVVANGPWRAERRLADSYRSGRVFLLGDAAHLHPPMGGYGMNMGVGDAVDLGWKLTAVLQGWGGEALLASYESERRPIHQRVIDEASANYEDNSNRYMTAALEKAGPEADALRAEVGAQIRLNKAREFATLGVQLGYRYEGSGVIVPDGTEEPEQTVGTYEPTARPGHLAPHAWVDGETCIYDLLGPGLTLLCFGGDPGSADSFAGGAAKRSLPLAVVEIDDPEIAELYGAPLVIVRPDQHVAWRGGDARDAGAVLDRIRGAGLGC